MGTCKGNVGHLMQHWTLCELLDIAGKHTSELSFIDAHAMAPRSDIPTSPDARFKSVRAGLPGKSVYEQAWHHLAPNGDCYPNSAAFVEQVWKGDFSLLLCEIDPPTIMDLEPWLECVQKLPRCKRAKLFPCDWRKRFAQGLPSVSEVGLADGALTLVSFDPNMYNRHQVNRPKKEILYQDDIELALDVMSSLKGGILIQLSTYNANYYNQQEAVIPSLNAILAAGDFTRCAVVRVHGHMMSLVYARNVSWSAELADLPNRFTEWLPCPRRS